MDFQTLLQIGAVVTPLAAVGACLRFAFRVGQHTNSVDEALRAAKEIQAKSDESQRERDQKIEDRLRSFDKVGETVIRFDERQKGMEAAISDLRVGQKDVERAIADLRSDKPPRRNR